VKTFYELTDYDAQLIASPRFEAVAGLFADAAIYGKLVDYGYGEPFTPVLRNSGEIDERARVIPLQGPRAALGEFVLTRDTISKMTRRHALGRIALPADELEILRTIETEEIDAMRGHIRSLAQQNNRTFGRSLFADT
jgi:hypothetical protein